MRNVRIIALRELGAYFGTPLAYIFVVIFVALTGAFAFFIGNFFERGQADLQAFFTYHPWLYLLLVPAIAMRLWAEERKAGTIELLMTLPVATWEAIVGKFVAAWAFIGIALALTFPMWLTVNYLGEPDNHVVFASYIGSFLMAGAFLAIGSAISALTKNQVIAFIVAATLCFLFVMSGAELVLNVVRSLTLGRLVLIGGILAGLGGLAWTATRGGASVPVAGLTVLVLAWIVAGFLGGAPATFLRTIGLLAGIGGFAWAFLQDRLTSSDLAIGLAVASLVVVQHLLGHLGFPNVGAVVGWAGALAGLVGLMLAASQGQATAGATSLAVMALAPYVGTWVRDVGSGFLVQAISSLSFLSHFEQFSKGVIGLPSLIFYVSLIGFFLFANIVIVEMRKAA